MTDPQTTRSEPPLTSIFESADRLRAYFMDRGWSIHMEDNGHAVIDPFAAIIEAVAASPPSAAPDLQRVREHLFILRGRAQRGWEGDPKWDVNEIEAALAALASPEPDGGLDVERLGEAIWNKVSSKPFYEHDLGDCEECDTHRAVVATDAAEIVAEYARLSRAAGDAPEPER